MSILRNTGKCWKQKWLKVQEAELYLCNSGSEIYPEHEIWRDAQGVLADLPDPTGVIHLIIDIKNIIRIDNIPDRRPGLTYNFFAEYNFIDRREIKSNIIVQP